MDRRLRVSSDPRNYALSQLHTEVKKRRNGPPPSMKKNLLLNHPDLTQGQKKYLGTICAAYSTTQMKHLVQDQYLQQLSHEAEKGIVSIDELLSYLKYIADPRKRKMQFQSHAKAWRSKGDTFNFRYHRKHAIDQPLPKIPIYVENEIKSLTRTVTIPMQRRYVTKRRRKPEKADSTFSY